MIKFLDTKEMVFGSLLSHEAILKKIAENIEKEKIIEFGKNNSNYSKLFVGKVLGNNFEIKKATSSRNLMMPILYGEVFDDVEGSNVKIIARPQRPWIMLIWLVGMVLGSILNIVVYFTNHLDKIFLYTGWLGIPIAAVMYYRYKFDVNQSVTSLKELVES